MIFSIVLFTKTGGHCDNDVDSEHDYTVQYL